MLDNRGAAMFEQEMRDRLAAATRDIEQVREQLATMTQRAEAAEAKLAAVPHDDICKAIAQIHDDWRMAASRVRDWQDSLIFNQEAQP